MMMSCRHSIIGLHLLLISHIAHAFVLLTANMEDVKKIARNFVSESLAEKIAEFVVKATQQITSTQPEVKGNAETQQFSEENSRYNIGKQESGSSEVQDNIKSKEEINNERQGEESSESVEDKPELDAQTSERNTEEPLVQHIVRESRSRFSVEPNSANHYAYPLQVSDRKEAKIITDDEDYDKDIQKSIKYLEENLIKTANTEDDQTKKRTVRNTRKVRHRLLSRGDSVERNEVEPKENQNVEDFLKNVLLERTKPQLSTTEKTVYEFDEYFNKNYPKSVFLASNGQGDLRKVNSNRQDKWWEKELPVSRHY